MQLVHQTSKQSSAWFLNSISCIVTPFTLFVLLANCPMSLWKERVVSSRAILFGWRYFYFRGWGGIHQDGQAASCLCPDHRSGAPLRALCYGWLGKWRVHDWCGCHGGLLVRFLCFPSVRFGCLFLFSCVILDFDFVFSGCRGWPEVYRGTGSW